MTDIDNSADIIDSRDLIARIEELQEMRTPYVAGVNVDGMTPGYISERFADADEARGWVITKMEADAADAEREGNIAKAIDLRAAAAEWDNNDATDADAHNSEELHGTTYYVDHDPSAAAGLDEDDAAELTALDSFADELRGYGDFDHGETIIRDSHFRDYAEQLADDIGAINSDASWPNNCIDWDRAARELQMDYVSADFNGVTYWMRA